MAGDRNPENWPSYPSATPRPAASSCSASSNAAKVIASLQHRKTQPFNRVITGLGIRMTGRTVGRRLAARFTTMDALRPATVEDIAEINKMGLIKAQHVVDGLAAMSGVIDRLTATGVTMSVSGTTGDKPSKANLRGQWQHPRLNAHHRERTHRAPRRPGQR